MRLSGTVLGAFILTSAISQSLASKSITVNQVTKLKVSKSNVHRGMADYVKALAKYKAPQDLIDHIQKAAIRHGKGTTPDLTRREADAFKTTDDDYEHYRNPAGYGSGPILALPNTYDTDYLVKLSIGGCDLWADFDTGRTDFWVFGKNVTMLDPSQTLWTPSPTARQSYGESWLVSYGDGTAVCGGVWSSDIVLGNITIPNATFDVVEIAYGDWPAPISGLIGLAFENYDGLTSKILLFPTLIDSGLISQPILAADLKHGAPGTYTFGAAPRHQYSGQLTYTPVNNTGGFWVITLLGIASNGKVLPPSARSSLEGIVDTGTTLLFLDDATVEWYWKQVSSAVYDYDEYSGWYFNCTEQLPDLEFIIGSPDGPTYTATIPGEYLNYRPIPRAEGKCFGGMQPTHGVFPANIFGLIFLKSTFAVFDRGTDGQGPRMGFADKSIQWSDDI